MSRRVVVACGGCELRPRAARRTFPEAYAAGLCQPCYLDALLEIEHDKAGHPTAVYGCPGCGLRGVTRPVTRPGGRAAPVASKKGTKVCKACGNRKPVQEFPTVWRTRRHDECRACRDERVDAQRIAEGRPPQHRCWSKPVATEDGGWACRVCGRVLVSAEAG